ncbi:ABC transporter substrate-binding protein [Prosthecobacter sp.]|uniref:ABC transporter substrate-binding protein n=1 Tax=Prosthecobacter sp. TaxID=1965333 RepID=UPI001E0A9383|nr:ABC transporter substrate-binding protein [Prosthecobacter sp.]MCB1277097.1 ABC transporter substrate-binding protein [Prosthecobacter sp.]
MLRQMNHSNAFLKRLLIPLCATLLLVAVFFYPEKEQERRLRVAPGMWPGAEALLLANEFKALPSDQFQIIEIPWSSAVIRALGSGAVDVAVTTLDNVLRMREAGQKVRVILVLDQSFGADAIVAGRNFPDLQSLKGRKVGVDLRGVGAYLLMNALEAAGMKSADIIIVPLVQPEMELAMEAGELDAAVVSEPWLTSLKRAGMHSIYDSKQLEAPILRVLVATERACSSSRQYLKTLLKAHSNAANEIRSAPPFKGLQSILRREGLSAEEFSSCLERLHFLDVGENAEMLEGDSPKLARLAAEMEKQMIKTGLLKTRAEDSTWIDPAFFKEAFR